MYIQIIKFDPWVPYGAIKSSCTVLQHGRALLSCKRNSRGTNRPIRTLVYEK